MANQKLDEVMELLNKVKERQDKYEKDYLKKDHDTASCNCFAGEKEKMEQHQELMKLSTIIDSIKVEVGQLAEMMEKQEQYLDDLEQYGRSNCLILHGNNIDHRISSMNVEKYVLNTEVGRAQLKAQSATSATCAIAEVALRFHTFLKELRFSALR